jgi:hypothetical protein
MGILKFEIQKLEMIDLKKPEKPVEQRVQCHF